MAEKIIVPRRGDDWFEYIDNPATGKREINFTLRAINFFENLESYTNDNTTLLAETTSITDSAVNARLHELQKQIGSGLPLTIDTTGFTIDNTFQTIDQTEV
jgi:hypothetical protein